MSKLYFLLPDEDTATNVVADLKAGGFREHDIGIVARDRAASLPVADASDTSDFKPAIAQGVVLGGGTGLLAGLALAVVPPAEPMALAFLMNCRRLPCVLREVTPLESSSVFTIRL